MKTKNQLIAKVLFGLEPEDDFYTAPKLIMAKLPFVVSAISGNGLSNIPFNRDWNYLMCAVLKLQEFELRILLGELIVFEDEDWVAQHTFDSTADQYIDRVYDAVFLAVTYLQPIEVETDDKEIHLVCPHCNNTESHPINEQHWHLQHFTFDQELAEVNKLECNSCHKNFYVKW